MDSSDLGSVVTDASEADYESVCDNFTDSEETSNLLYVNVTFNDSIERFILSRFVELSTLENKVAKRLKLDGQGFHLKYIDEANDLIVICCDDDLKLALDTLGSNNSINLIYEKTSF
ncbi:putative PB1 domain-containing protein [Helianthus anomalus]